MNLIGKRFIVFGGTGAIGGEVVKQLTQEGARVWSMSRHALEMFSTECVVNRVVDVASPISLIELEARIKAESTDDEGHFTPFDGIVFAVGVRYEGGFDGAIRYSLFFLPMWCLEAEMSTHVYGLQNILTHFESLLKPKGCFVVVSSAITRLTARTCPPWLYAGHYAAAKAAQDELVRWWRRDQVVRAQKLLIHRLAFGAVETPFHANSEHRPSRLIPLEKAGSEIVRALGSKRLVDKTVLS